MKTMRNCLLALLCSLTLISSAHAGRSCEERKPSLPSFEQGLKLAQKVMESLDASGQQVVVLARAGQDLSKYRLRYSHLGFAYRQPDGNGGHVWRVLHKLNQCGTDESAIYRQGLGEFFLDDPWRFEAAYAIPTREVQDKLLPVLLEARKPLAMHRTPYSIVSYVWGNKYQQSNQWLIETLAAAMDPSIDSRKRAQGWLEYMGYQPAVLRLGPLTRLGGRLTAANVAFDDHPPEKRFSDRIETVSADSVFEWMQMAQLAGRVIVVR